MQLQCNVLTHHNVSVIGGILCRRCWLSYSVWCSGASLWISSASITSTDLCTRWSCRWRSASASTSSWSARWFFHLIDNIATGIWPDLQLELQGRDKDELIRFWVQKVKVTARPNKVKNSLWTRYHKNRSYKFHQMHSFHVGGDKDELIRFWGQKVKGQGHSETTYGQISTGSYFHHLSTECLDTF